MKKAIKCSVVGAVCLAIAACGPSGTSISIPPESFDLPVCDEELITVDQLADVRQCNLEDATLEFPDGVALPIDKIGVSFAADMEADGSRTIRIDNLGTLGVVASEYVEGRFTIWGSEDGILAVLEVTPEVW